MHHFKMLNWFLVSLLLHVGLSINVKTLSILEYSLSESKSTKCDLVVLGKDLLNDLHEEKELHHPLILIFNGTDVEYATMKTLNLLAKCLILFMSESSHSLNEVRHLAKRLQYSKPVGVVYSYKVKKDLSIFEVEDGEDQNWPFPIIFQYVNGMYHDKYCKPT